MSWGRTGLAVMLLLATALPLPNCAGNTGSSTSTAALQQPDPNTSPAAAPIIQSADHPTAESMMASASAADPGEYKISQRDILDISVFQVPEMTKSVQVGDDGNVSLPLIGKVMIKGKSAHEAEEIIADRLSKKYLQSPQVTVFVKQYGQKVTVNGEVKSPRVLALEGSLTLTQAIAYAGGLGDLADTKRVHVARAINGHVQDEVYNFNDIQAGRASDPVLQGGDLVVAEQSGVQVVFKNMKDMLPFAVLATIL